jgi:hypothetical protein
MRPIYDSDMDTIASCLGIIERGLRRLGIDPHAPLTRAAARTMQSDVDTHAQMKAAAIQRRGAYDLSEHQVARMIELAHAGRTQAEIARELGCVQSTVAKRLLKAGIRRGRRRQPLAA